jgi:hypothetical protein
MPEEAVGQKVIESLGMAFPIDTKNIPPGSDDRMMCEGTDKAILDKGTVFFLVTCIEKERLPRNKLWHRMTHIVCSIHPITAIFPQKLYTTDIRKVAGLHSSGLPFLPHDIRQVYPTSNTVCV